MALLFDKALDKYHNKQRRINLADVLDKDILLRISCNSLDSEGNDDDEVSNSLPRNDENLGDEDIETSERANVMTIYCCESYISIFEDREVVELGCR